ncbi:MAG: hypothetical protein RLZZ602_89 [Pseudomonadota bacterium]|jgi:flagellar basal-body rod protein FlgB
MSGPLDSITSALVGKSLDASLAVHQVIAHNIANVNSTGFRPLSVNFEQLMSDMTQALNAAPDPAALRERLANIAIDVEPDQQSDSVQLDQQMVLLAKNTTHYQALLSARSLYGELVGMAIRGGKA